MDMSSNSQHCSLLPSIPEFFSGKTLAVTGCTGFLGQLLIEKLLRSCPDIKRILLFIRSKRGIGSKERLQKITELPIFDKLRVVQPNFTSKLVVIPCDLEKEGFGLDEKAINLINSEVNIFFHSAATLRFNEHLRLSYELNTLAIRRVLKLCRSILKLEAIVHISTAYSFCNHDIIEEKVYPTGWDYDKLHDAMQWLTDDMISKLTPDIVNKRPNTYTLTKSFGEEVVVKEGEGLPVCIVRPSIVGATWKDPIPGWCVNINGPTGMFIAYGKGFLRLLNMDEGSSMDIIPADFVINGIIAAAWKTGVAKLNANSQRTVHPLSAQSPIGSLPSCNDLKTMGYVKPVESEKILLRRSSVPIYHLVANTAQSLTVSKICELVNDSYTSFPLDNAFRIPDINSVSNKYLFRTMSFFVQYLPAYMFDTGLMLIGQKPKLLRLTQKVLGAMEILQYFCNHHWVWKEGNTLQLESELSAKDRKEFYFNTQAIDWRDYVKHYCYGTKKFILKEDPQGLPAARRHLWRLRVLSWCFQFATFMIVWRLLVSRSAIGRNLWHLFMSLWFKFLRFFQISSTLHKNYIFSRFFS